jgi:hypothetical protein
MKILIPDCWLENIFSPYFCIENQGIDEMHSLVPHRNYPFIITVILSWGMHIQNSNIAPSTS